jgi:hypothetical protein
LAQTRKTRASKREGDDVVFEGVLIPGETRSAKLAKKGINSEEEIGKFLTAVFADTLNGKIVLPKANSESDGYSRILNGLEEKVKLGLPVGIQATNSVKQRRPSKMKKS